MFTFETRKDKYGNDFKYYKYKPDEDDEIVGVLYGHFAPFTGPNGHGRMLTALQNIGAKQFLVATPDSRDRIDEDRMLFTTEQRREIIQKALAFMNIDGQVVTPSPRSIDKMFDRLKRLVCDVYGPKTRPVFCFGPDREEEFSQYLSAFGSDDGSERAEYIVDRVRGTSGTKVRQLIKAGDIAGVEAQTGYNEEIAQMLISMWSENKERLASSNDDGMAGKHSLHHLWNDNKSTQMTYDEFFSLIDFLDKQADDKISKVSFNISEKIDGSSSFVGVDKEGLFFTKFGYSSKSRSASQLPPKYKKFFDELEDSGVEDALSKWRDKLHAKEVKVQIENVLPEARRQDDDKYVRIVLVPYLASKIGNGLVVTIQALVDGKETDDEKAIMADVQKALKRAGLNARGTVSLDFNDIDLREDIDKLKAEIKKVEASLGQDIKTLLSGSKRLSTTKEAMAIVSKYQKQIQDKIISQFPAGQFGDYYEGLVLTAANGMVFKVTSDKFKQLIAGGIRESMKTSIFDRLLNEGYTKKIAYLRMKLQEFTKNENPWGNIDVLFKDILGRLDENTRKELLKEGDKCYAIQKSGKFNVSATAQTLNNCGGNLVLIDFGQKQADEDNVYIPQYCNDTQIEVFLEKLEKALEKSGIGEESFSYKRTQPNFIGLEIKDSSINSGKTFQIKLRQSASGRDIAKILCDNTTVVCAGVSASATTAIEETAIALSYNKYETAPESYSDISGKIYKSVYTLVENNFSVTPEQVKGVIDDWQYTVGMSLHLMRSKIREICGVYSIPMSSSYTAYRDKFCGKGNEYVQQLFESSFYGGGQKDISNPSDIYLVSNATVCKDFMKKLIAARGTLADLGDSGGNKQVDAALWFIKGHFKEDSKLAGEGVLKANALVYSGIALGVSLKKLDSSGLLNYTGTYDNVYEDEELKINFVEDKNAAFIYIDKNDDGLPESERSSSVIAYEVPKETGSGNASIKLHLNPETMKEHTDKVALSLRTSSKDAKTASIMVGKLGAAQGGRCSGKNLQRALQTVYNVDMPDFVAPTGAELLEQVKSFIKAATGKDLDTTEAIDTDVDICRALSYILAAGMKYKVIDTYLSESRKTSFNKRTVDYFKIH